MKKLKYKIVGALYRNLSNNLRKLIPEEMDGTCSVIQGRNGKDRVIIGFEIPHELTKKLMWSMKAWRAN